MSLAEQKEGIQQAILADPRGNEDEKLERFETNGQSTISEFDYARERTIEQGLSDLKLAQNAALSDGKLSNINSSAGSNANNLSAADKEREKQKKSARLAEMMMAMQQRMTLLQDGREAIADLFENYTDEQIQNGEHLDENGKLPPHLQAALEAYVDAHPEIDIDDVDVRDPNLWHQIDTWAEGEQVALGQKIEASNNGNEKENALAKITANEEIQADVKEKASEDGSPEDHSAALDTFAAKRAEIAGKPFWSNDKKQEEEIKAFKKLPEGARDSLDASDGANDYLFEALQENNTPKEEASQENNTGEPEAISVTTGAIMTNGLG